MMQRLSPKTAQRFQDICIRAAVLGHQPDLRRIFIVGARLVLIQLDIKPSNSRSELVGIYSGFRKPALFHGPTIPNLADRIGPQSNEKTALRTVSVRDIML